jgi:alkylation response protein AidB-like acyl-CoA dehydrogenase
MNASTTTSRTVEEILTAVGELRSSLASGVAEAELVRRLPYDSVEALRASGLTFLRVPTLYGGPGATLPDLFGAVITIATADPNLAQGLRSHFGFVEGLLLRASQADRERWLPEVLAGRIFGLAEAELGVNDPTQWRTTLAPDAVGTLRLNGRKYYSTGSLFADWIEVVAVDTAGRLTSVVVPSDRAGVELIDDFDGMGQRATASGTTVFTDVAVHPGEILHGTDFTDSDRPFNYHGGFYQLYLASVTAGIARNVFDDATTYVRTKARVANHSVAASPSEDPYVLEAVGEIGALAFAAESVVAHAAQRLELAASPGAAEETVIAAAIDVAKTQLVASRAAMEAAERIFETGGASATSSALNFSRHWRNARTIASHNPLAYKARATGDYAVNHSTPPKNGYF